MDGISHWDWLQLDVPVTLSDPTAAAALVVVYLGPTIISLGRGSKGISLILLLNIALGWTLVGWIWAMILAFRPITGSGHEHTTTFK